MAKATQQHSSGNGKLIDTIHYDYEQEAGGKVVTGKVEIKIFMQKRYGTTEAPPLPVTAVQFMATCAEHVEYGTDLNVVVKAMRGKLDAQYKIAWENWLEVRVESSKSHRGVGAGLELTWTNVERGVTLEGDVLLRRYNTYGDFNNKWEISAWPKQFRDKSGKTLACIPETDANVAALEKFRDKIVEMRKLLSSFVSPDSIEETLRMIANDQFMLTSGTPTYPEV
jgi:hypothetical protein